MNQIKYKIHSKAFLRSDLQTEWYNKWARLLNQTKEGRGNFALKANKFWQNATIAQALHERNMLTEGKRAVGFGVGKERLPALFASLGVEVVATDQDATADKAASWDNDQLAHGIQSLNTDGVCPVDTFGQNVTYHSVDMTDIPEDLNGQFDFLWTNCALGHLGSIEKSKEFIEKSLDCLKSNGWAVHTTEANILSDEDTLDHSDTVFFRQRDLYELFRKLSGQGYVVNALDFNLGSASADQDFTLNPPWGTHHSKLLFNGYMATQIVLIIKKPAHSNLLTRRLQVYTHAVSYRRSLIQMRKYLESNQKLQDILAMDKAARADKASDTKVMPITKIVKLRSNKEKSKVTLTYRNDSRSPLFVSGSNFKNTAPLTVATASPINHDSPFQGDDWHSGNRPRVVFTLKGHTEHVDYIKPGQSFEATFSISTNKRTRDRKKEQFCLVKEGDNAIPGTEITLIVA